MGDLISLTPGGRAPALAAGALAAGACGADWAPSEKDGDEGAASWGKTTECERSSPRRRWMRFPSSSSSSSLSPLSAMSLMSDLRVSTSRLKSTEGLPGGRDLTVTEGRLPDIWLGRSRRELEMHEPHEVLGVRDDAEGL